MADGSPLEQEQVEAGNGRPAARYIMIGGFLGAGKSTSVGRLARHLTDQGLRVGLITNDQGAGLVDTRNLRSQGFDVEEIAGGCFCCRFNSLRDAAEKLGEESRPDVFIAEPVGSCTDLLATVTYPLRRLYGNRFAIAPLSVVVDPLRAARVLGVELSEQASDPRQRRRKGRSFSPKVTYVYLKQLEEAQVIVVNKTDLLTDDDCSALVAALSERFPEARVLTASARQGDGLQAWFDELLSAGEAPGQPLDIDYGIYGEGEALLGWLNAAFRVDAPQEFDGNAWLRGLADGLQERLSGAGAEVAHLKMTLSPDGGFREIGLVNLVHQELVPEVGEELPSPLRSGELVVNLRAEAAPEDLQVAVEQEMASRGSSGVGIHLEHMESFRPGQPDPTHRMTSWSS